MRRVILAVAITLAVAAQPGTPKPAANSGATDQACARVAAERSVPTSTRSSTEGHRGDTQVILLMAGVGSSGVLR